MALTIGEAGGQAWVCRCCCYCCCCICWDKRASSCSSAHRDCSASYGSSTLQPGRAAMCSWPGLRRTCCLTLLAPALTALTLLRLTRRARQGQCAHGHLSRLAVLFSHCFWFFDTKVFRSAATQALQTGWRAACRCTMATARWRGSARRWRSCTPLALGCAGAGTGAGTAWAQALTLLGVWGPAWGAWAARCFRRPPSAHLSTAALIGAT